MLRVNVHDPASVHDSDRWIKCCSDHSETHICATEDIRFGGKRLVVGASLHRIHASAPTLFSYSQHLNRGLPCAYTSLIQLQA